MDAKTSDRLGPDFLIDRAMSRRSPSVEQGIAGRGDYTAEIRTAAEMDEEIEAWRDLARRAVEPNVFAEPELVIPGVQHLTEGRGVMLLLVWEGERSTAGGGVLRGLFPLLMPRFAVARQIRIWSPAFASSGVPLVDYGAPVEIIEAALAFLTKRYARFTGLGFGHVATDGPFAAALRSAATRTRRAITSSETRGSLILRNAYDGDGPTDTMRRKIVDDLRDGRQRLAVLGDVEMDHARTSRWVRDAVEEFLVLDASGAGKRGEALLQKAGMASLLRIATRQLARAGRCRVDVLRVAGRPIAAAIIIESGRQAWLWRLAADASLAEMAPETQLILDVTRTQLDRPGLVRTEACPGCDGASTPAFWQQGTATHFRVTIRPQSTPAALIARIGERLRRRLRPEGRLSAASAFLIAAI